MLDAFSRFAKTLTARALKLGIGTDAKESKATIDRVPVSVAPRQGASFATFFCDVKDFVQNL